MPKRDDIHTILIIGAGPIVIGQACEFDYSGTQACRALKEEGYRVVLVNSNPATIMTDPEFSDATYIEPVTPEFVERIIEKERPDALLPTVGGQTALNIASVLHESGVLEKYNVEMIGVRYESIRLAEDRKLFCETIERIGLKSPKSRIITLDAHHADDKSDELDRGVERALETLEDIGLPAVIRPSFTLGGTGGGIACNREEFINLCRMGLDASPVGQILIDESLIGYKEFEMEVVCDKVGNSIIVCSIENIDPMGVHTGDSVTIAPAMTLTDKEYQFLRTASVSILREIGVETGGANVQFAIHPDTGDVYVIEMNPRVSRSSALASKATGFPIARVAARLAVGFTLDELANDMTQTTPASFEPSIDYVVVKIPRFNFEKFPDCATDLNTSMKSVGEVMSIGRSFHETLQKALVSLDRGLEGLDNVEFPAVKSEADDGLLAVEQALKVPTANRILYIAQAIREGISLEKIKSITHYDLWFLNRIKEIIDAEASIIECGVSERNMPYLKRMGFSDARIARLCVCDEEEITALRHSMGIHPVFKRIDTCAAEFPCTTSYMYSTYEGPHGECEAAPSDARKVVILGSGPNCIGQGIEFDYCCSHAAMELSECGYETIMVNCNPETVSTDYDTSDRLYFEPLSFENVMEILLAERKKGELLGVIVQFGGQTSLKISDKLTKAGFTLLGSQPDTIKKAENREDFNSIISKLGLRQPKGGIAYDLDKAKDIINNIVGYPAMIRPSNVLGGRSMEIVRKDADLELYMGKALKVSEAFPILVDSYLSSAIEVDVDALCDVQQNCYVTSVMEHIEEAGVHSGDSACSIPPHSLGNDLIADIEQQTIDIARALDVVGLINVQFAIQGSEVFVLEANPRASRTIPFVAKTIGIPIAKIAARLMVGENLNDMNLPARRVLDYCVVKESVLPFSKFPGTAIALGPEMRSTGEVMGIGPDFPVAYCKSQIAADNKLCVKGSLFVSIKDNDKIHCISPLSNLIKQGFDVYATRGTAAFLAKYGLNAKIVNKVCEGSPDVIELMKSGKISLVFNTYEGAEALADSNAIRNTALAMKIPHYTTLPGIRAVVLALDVLASDRVLEVASLQTYNARCTL